MHETYIGHVKNLSHNNHLLYGDWINEIISSPKTWVGLHWNWPVAYNLSVPDDMDDYVFSWHLEPCDIDWLLQFADDHPNQQITVIGEFDPVILRPNIRMLKWHCWHLLIATYLKNAADQSTFSVKRRYLLSALCAKANIFKSLVIAYLCMQYSNDARILYTYNPSNKENSMSLLDMPIPNPVVDSVRQWAKQNLPTCKNVLPHTGIPNRAPMIDNQFVGHDSWINVTNETFCRSNRVDIGLERIPGPYLTEKTFNPLLAGCAILPNGQPYTYQYLQEFGFQFDYPWSMKFDDEIGDLMRLESLYRAIDYVLQQDQHCLVEQIKASCEHNWNHVRSPEFIATIESTNQRSLERFLTQDPR